VTVIHKNIRPVVGDPLAGAHVIHYYTFADLAARNALNDTYLGVVTLSASDVGRVARVGSAAPYVFYTLVDHASPEWRPMGAGGLDLSFMGEVTGVTPFVIGAVYLTVGTMSDVSRVLAGVVGTGTATVQLIRQSDSTVIATWTSALDAPLDDVLLGVSVPIAAAGWYVFDLAGNDPATVTRCYGAHLEF
jgi:hypothetical protein